jgi:uncharacterized protein (TIGR00299 family) protein
MRTLAFDGRMGASGDMILAALLAAGADSSVLAPVKQRLDIEYDIGETPRCGISATSVDVLHTGSDDSGDSHDHDHHHSHEYSHNHSHGHDHAEGAGPTRTFPEVVEIVESMELSHPVERDAIEIFTLLGEAEASVHGTELEETHFHEVGADDAIADIVGAVLLLDDLGLDQIVTTPLSTGSGEVAMSHGTYPVPTPAVVELAERADWSLRGGPVETELLTPTGAAILAHFTDGVESLPSVRIDSSGYGAGGKSFSEHPNVLRAIVGETAGELCRDSITVLETNLDDATPETLGGLHDTLADAGALDVSVLPATMKKSRPGHLVKVIVKPENARQVARKLAEETGTLGVREHGAGHRFIAARKTRTVTVEIADDSFDIDVKVASLGEDGQVYDVSGEYDDASRIAAETGATIRDILERAEAVAREQL